MSNTNTKIYSEAIAEAKSIRETAMENAKLALEEAFAPRMQEMMSNKLASLAEEDLEEYGDEHPVSVKSALGDEDEDEMSLEELISELDSIEEYGDEHPVSVKSALGDEDEDEMSLQEAEDEDSVSEITVDELKDIIRGVVADLMGGEGEEEGPEEEEAPEEGEEEAPESEDELNLDEILAELDSLNETSQSSIAQSKDLEKALETISVLRSELNEVNLLNAKLLYVNKLFKSKNLTEAQKVKVINAFDRAETVKETKNIFETLKESFTTVKNPIKESLSFASKPAGVAPNKQPIVENDDFMKRMQKIAGII